MEKVVVGARSVAVVNSTLVATSRSARVTAGALATACALDEAMPGKELKLRRMRRRRRRRRQLHLRRAASASRADAQFITGSSGARRVVCLAVTYLEHPVSQFGLLGSTTSPCAYFMIISPLAQPNRFRVQESDCEIKTVSKKYQRLHVSLHAPYAYVAVPCCALTQPTFERLSLDGGDALVMDFNGGIYQVGWVICPITPTRNAHAGFSY